MRDSPVFIVGMNGSGTTMLADCLGKHPQLFVFGYESKVLPYFASQAEAFGDLSFPHNRRRLADAIGKTRPFWQANHRSALVLDESLLSRCTTFGDIVAQIYTSLAARKNKSRWGDKSPANTYHIGLLARSFPDAQFLHIIRDGRDAAQSFHRRWGYSPLHTIWRWKRAVLDGRLQGSALPANRYMEIRYETLTSSPESEMRRICKFLGLGFDKAVLHASMLHVDKTHGSVDSNQIVKNSGKWREYFSARQLSRLEAVAGQLLQELGYPVTSSGDGNVGSVRLKILTIRDGIAYTADFFKHHGIKSLPTYVRSISAAMKQWSAMKR